MSTSVVTSHQPSLTEWLSAIGEIEASNAFREEDNRKIDRLELLYQTIGLPYERPEALPTRELSDPSPRFQEILDKRGNELCAIRLVPNKPNLPKLRERGLTIRECYEQWYLKQAIHPDDYTAFICPHSDTLLWSAIFVITQEGIYGEIVQGMHNQLTQGNSVHAMYQFSSDFEQWTWSQRDPAAEGELQRMLTYLQVTDQEKQRVLCETLNSTFAHDYLTGYFEATVWPNNKVNIIDYNRVLPSYLPHSLLPTHTEEVPEGAPTLKGASASTGCATGRVRIVQESDIEATQLSSDEILVCDNTDVRYLPLMKACAAIVTNRGGILSHAAIVSRELKKPCIVGTKEATTILKNGDLIKVEADHGRITLVGSLHS